MRKAAVILGIIGGAIGILGVLPAAEAPLIAIWGFLSSLMALVGAALALTKPKVAGILMLASAISGWGAAFMFLYAYMSLVCAWGPTGFLMARILASFFLIPGGVLALASHKEQPAPMWAAMIPGMMGGLFLAVSALTADPPHMLQEEELLAWVISFRIWVLLSPIMGFSAGILLALVKPKVPGILMLISGIIGYIGPFALGIGRYNHLEHALCILGGLLLIVGGALALAARKRRPREGMPPWIHPVSPGRRG